MPCAPIEALIIEAMRCAGTRSKRETVDLALRQLVAKPRQRAILDLIAEDLIDPNYDVRAVRRNMSRDAG